MSKSSIKYIRERRKVPAYIGRIVHYDGRRYRIAWTTSTGGLVLRDEIIVHPADPLLNYTGDPNKALIEDEDCAYLGEATLAKLNAGYFTAIDESKPEADNETQHDCPRCDSCGIELGEDVGYYGPGMKWIDASVALYPWRGEYYCGGCLDEEFAMLRRDMEEGSVTVFFGADEMDMPDELVIEKDSVI